MFRIPGLQATALNRIIVEALPLLKRPLGLSVIFLGIPVQHPWIIVHSNLLAVCLDNAVRVIEQVIRINHRDAHLPVLQVPLVLASDCWADMSPRLEEVEDAAKLVVASLAGIEVVKSGHLVERRDGAAEVGGDAAAGVADQECEVELLQDLLRDHGGVSGLGLGVVRVWSRRGGITVGDIAVRGMAIGSVAVGRSAIGITIRGVAVGSNTVGNSTVCADTALGCAT